MKRKTVLTDSSSDKSLKKEKRQITLTTFNKWQVQFDRDYNSLCWLRCETNDNALVEKLWCHACRKYESYITGMKNFSSAWIKGSTNQKTSNVMDHATSEQHTTAMARMQADNAKASKVPLAHYAPIAKRFSKMDAITKERLKKKFDVCYLLAKENMAFLKYPAILELEERHGVDVGFAYRTKDSAKIFTHYIAESQRQCFLAQEFSSVKFFSFLMDGSTDTSNTESELIMIMYCKKDDNAQEMRSCIRYVSMEALLKADAEGLMDSLNSGLRILGVENLCHKELVLHVANQPVVVGGGTDGASVNIAEQNGLKGRLQKELPWLFWTWCFAHRLELACKNALSSTLFREISDMLAKLFSIYSKSPKKSRELSEIVEDLKMVFDLPASGNLPVRCNGTRWISHKRKALQRLLDRYGAYINHLATLSEDLSIASADRARLKGYCSNWMNFRMLIGAAMYTDILKSPSCLSLTLQEEKLDVIKAIQHLLKARKSLQSLSKQNPVEWPSVSMVYNRIVEDESSKIHSYQGVALTNCSHEKFQQYSNEVIKDLKRLDDKLKERLEWSDLTMLRSILVFLDTQSWFGSLDKEKDGFTEIIEAVEYIIAHFREPLEAKGGDMSSILDEVEDAVQYARKFFSITDDYHKIWYKLHVVPNASKWPNVLLLCSLLFSLPVSNGRVESIFSSMNVIKTERRASMHTDTLSDLIEIHTEGASLADFLSDDAIQIWWTNCSTSRRVNQAPRKAYRARVPRRKPGSVEIESVPSSSTTSTASISTDADVSSEGSSDESEGTTQTIALADWDNWFVDKHDHGDLSS